MTRRFFRWFFQNRETGAITIAQAANLSLWIVIVAGVLIWAWHPPDRLGVALEVISAGWSRWNGQQRPRASPHFIPLPVAPFAQKRKSWHVQDSIVDLEAAIADLIERLGPPAVALSRLLHGDAANRRSAMIIPISVGREISRQHAMDRRHGEHQHQLAVKPGCGQKIAAPGEPQAQHPSSRSSPD
jgi:hypothetical protein